MEKAEHLCADCVGNEVFAQWIRSNGKQGKCDFNSSHAGKHAVVSVESFAAHVDEWFRENYGRGEEHAVFEGDSDSPTYETYGDPYKFILIDQLECEEIIVDAISDQLPDADWHDISQGDETFYDDTANYESRDSVEKRSRQEEEEYWYENRISYQWDDFCKAVQYERRFFRIKEQLDDLFGKPEEYNSGETRPIYFLKRETTVYRARLLDDAFTERQIDEAPALALGAPPQEKARAGRMNVEFIPAFYAAFSSETAVAELRPSIGDRIAIGKFRLHRELKVFDFTAFSRSNRVDDPKIYSHTRYDFVSEMEEEISKPVLGYEKQREYIATQIVAEYLREYFKCDAVIYRSSMHKGEGIENRNIVIFGPPGDFLAGGNRQILDLKTHSIAQVTNVTFETAADDDFF